MGCQFNRSTQHMLLLDGVYTGGHAAQAKPRFQRVKAPDRAELEQLVYTISERTGRYLERLGLLVRDLDNSYLALEPDETGLEGVLGSSITYRIAVGPQQGRKAFCLQSLRRCGEDHCQHRGSGGDREDPGACGGDGAGP